MRIALRMLALGLFAAGIGLLAGQVEVRADDVVRGCGSSFDALVDRSGWEQWWAADLAEVDATVRSRLLRTNECPDAVNRSMLGAGALVVAAVAVVATTLQRRPHWPRGGGLAPRLKAWGTVTLGLSTGLLVAGIVALAVFTADADATLFQYVDRLVVALIGLIALIPVVALFVIGAVLRLVGGDLLEREVDDG